MGVFFAALMALPALFVGIGAYGPAHALPNASAQVSAGPVQAPSHANSRMMLPPTFNPGSSSPLVAAPQVSPTVGINYQATWDPSAQNEPGIAVNPTNPLDIIVSGNDYDTAATGSSGSWASEFTSLNGGQSWYYRPAAMNSTFAGGHPCFGGDSNVFFAPDGTAYFAGLGYPTAQTARCSGSTSTNGGLFVAHSTDGGLTWTYVRVEQDVGSTWVDKEWMGIDPTTGTVSIEVMNYSSTAYIDYWYSTNHGASWVGPRHVNPSTDQNMVAAGLAIDSSGGVDVVWQGGASGNDIEFSRATAPGQAFSAEANLGTITCAPAGSSGFPAIGGVARMNCFPQIFGDTWAGSPYRGDLYIVYTENVSSLQIKLLRSTNLGTSWSSAIAVNNDPSDGADHWWPQLAVGTNGTVFVEFLDRRYVPRNFYVDTTVAVSQDGGLSFPLNVRVSSVSGNPTVWSAFMGDYENTFWSPAGDFSVWTDFRNGLPGNLNENLYVGQLSWLNLSSNVAGVPAMVDGSSLSLPTTEYWTRGTVHNISVPTSLVSGGVTYTFSHWQGMFSSTSSSLTNVAMNDSSPLLAIYNVAGALPLSVTVSTVPYAAATSGSAVAVMASVTSGGSPFAGATVTFSDTLSDTFAPNPVTTGTNGDAWTNFTAPTVLSATADTVTAAATASGYSPGSGTVAITIDPTPLLVALKTTPSGNAVGGAVVFAEARVSLSSGAPVAGATVALSDSVGSTFSPATAASDAAGYVYSNFTTPAVASPTTDTIDAAATAPGHPGGNGTTTIALQPVPNLSVALVPMPSSGRPGTKVVLRATVSGTSGPYAGATVTFADQRGDPFSPASGTSSSGGTVWSNLTLPTTSFPLTLVVWANATATLARPGGTSTTVAVEPVLAGSIVVPASPVTAGLPAALSISVASAGTAIGGASLVYSDVLGGVFSPSTGTSALGTGMAYTNVTVASVSAPYADTITVTVSDGGYVSATLTATLEVDPAPPMALNLSATAYVATAGSSVPVRVTLQSTGAPVAGASESFRTSAGSLDILSATTPTNGTVELLLAAPSPTAATSVTVTASASEPGYTAATGTLRLYVVLVMSLALSISPTTVVSGGTAQVEVLVEDASGAPVSAAQVSLSASQGTISPSVGTTDSTGKLTVQYTAPNVSSTTTATITATATAPGRETTQGSAQVTDTPPSPGSGQGGLMATLTSPLVLAAIAVAVVAAVAILAVALRKRRSSANDPGSSYSSVPPGPPPMYPPPPPG